MSSNSTPISAHSFATAIKDLPLANLYFKATEIRNSIAHLVSSNNQLQSFADDGDPDCQQAIEENRVVIQRMEGRVQLLRREVEARGFVWDGDEHDAGQILINGLGHADNEAEHVSGVNATSRIARPSGDSLGDEELAQRPREQIGEDQEVEDHGVHL